MLEFSSTESCTTSTTSSPLVGFSSNTSSCDGNVALMNDFESTEGCSGQGPQGPEGFSAYQIAVFDGFVGTETQWLASLVGPGVPVGGTAGQILAKIDLTNYNTQWINSPSLTGFVPYIGATQALNLGAFSLTANSIIKNGGTSSQYLMADGTTSLGFVLPSLTSGSVLFSNGTTIAQDNSSFFWDNTNKRLGIGTATPTSSLYIKGAGSAALTNSLTIVNSLSRNLINIRDDGRFDIGSTLTVSNININSSGENRVKLFSTAEGTDSLQFYTNGGAYGSSYGEFGYLFKNTATQMASINFDTRTSVAPFRFFVNPTSGSAIDAMDIFRTGEVGINTTNTNLGGKLQIKAGGAAITDIALRIRDSGDTVDLLTVDGTGALKIRHNTFTGTMSFAQTANSTSVITGGPASENITFGPSNRIFLNASQVAVNFLHTVGTINSISLAGVAGNSLAITSNSSFAGSTGILQNHIKLTSIVAQQNTSPVFNALYIEPTINNTTTITAIARGIYYNPILTSLTGTTHIALETVTGNVIFGSTSGNVGIGTTTPISIFQVKTTTANTNGSISFLNNSASTIASITDTGSALTMLQFRASSYNFTDCSGLRIASTGYANAPSAMLNVIGAGFTSTTTTLLIQNNSLTSLLAIRDDGMSNIYAGTFASGIGVRVNATGTYASSGLNLHSDAIRFNQTGILYFTQTSSVGSPGYTLTNSTTFSPTAGTANDLNIGSGFSAAAGAALYRPLTITYTLNNTGAQTGTATGIFLNSTETALNGMVHNLMDLQIGGVSKAKISAGGTYQNIFSSVGGNSPGSYGAVGSNYYIDSVGTLRRSFSDSGGFLQWSTNGAFLFNGFNSGVANSAISTFLILDVSSVGTIRWGTTNLYPAIKRNGAAINFRLADDSAGCNITANNFTSTVNNATFGMLTSSYGSFTGSANSGFLEITETANNKIRLNTGTLVFNSTINCFNGTTNLFPAIKRNAAAIDFRLADDSGYCNINTSNIFINGDTSTPTPPFATLNQTSVRLAVAYSTQVSHFISNTADGGTGDTSLALFGLGTGGGYFGGIRFFTSSNSRTPVLGMILDRNQSLGIGLTDSTNLTCNASAKLQIDSTTKGFLPPRMTNTEMLTILTPAVGLMVYCTDVVEGVYVNKSTGWTFIA